MQLRIGLTLALTAIGLAGCSHFQLDNRSLEYKQHATTLAPLQVPVDASVRPTAPLYPAPIIEPGALEQAPIFENYRGTRFQLPRPELMKAEAVEVVKTALSRPQLLTDGNQNPLLKVEGDAATVWQYTLATLSSLNYQVNSKNKNSYEATVKVNGQMLTLRLSSAGSSHNIAVFDANNNFADKAKATELLSQIYQNWPA